MCSVQVNLGRNKLGDEGTEFIATALKESPTSKLQTLKVYGNNIGAKGAAAMASYMAGSASLTECDLGSNPSIGYNSGDEGTNFIAMALKESPTSKLQKLEMHNNGISPKGATALAAYVAISASLTEVRWIRCAA